MTAPRTIQQLHNLQGRNALITGGSRGLGLQMAHALGEAGARLLITSRKQAELDAAASELRSAGHTVDVLATDGRDDAQVLALVDHALATLGHIDILVNNAGITRDNLAMRMKDEDWDAVLETNLTSVFRLSRAVMRSMMKARWGRIINITSVVGSSGNPGQANYAAAKAGVAGMSRALARELGSRGVTVNCVAPGFIETDMTAELGESQTAALLGQIPLGRLGSASDIAHAVAFLASPNASYITGTTLHVNGGMYL